MAAGLYPALYGQSGPDALTINGGLTVGSGGMTVTGACALPAGTTIGGQPAPGGGANVVNTTATTLSLTAALHANKVLVVDTAAAFAFILPAATGTGNVYRVFIDTAATATSSTISSVATAEVFAGRVVAHTTASNAVIGFVATATDNTLTLDGTVKGGVKGDTYVFTDVKASTWSVQGESSPTGSYATPFSHV